MLISVNIFVYFKIGSIFVLLNNINMNCLSYALRFWEKHRKYKILYNSYHCINVPCGTSVEGFLPIEEFKYNYFYNWYETGLIEELDLELLKKYFNIGEKLEDHPVGGKSKENMTFKEFLDEKQIDYIIDEDSSVIVDDDLLKPYERELKELFPKFLFLEEFVDDVKIEEEFDIE